jgi:hypothetical protein
MWRRSLSKDFAPMDKGNGEEQASDVKIDEPIRSHDDMK